MIYSAAGARRVAFDVDGRQLAALHAGDGPAVLLVPGFTGSKEDFAPILAPLADAGFAVTAIDQPGQFESPGPPDRAEYTPDRLARAVLAVTAALPGPVRLLGHSFGGLVARAAVIASASSFDSLVLLSSGPADLGGARRVRMSELEPVLATGGLSGVYAAMQAAAAEEPGFAPPPPEVERFLERRFLHGSPQMLQGMADALRAEPDRVEELAATGVRTLVVHGVDDDAWPPADQQDMARRLGARYEVVSDAAHSAAEENPADLVAVLVDFWR
ncbi:alpha/beta fold hydrolase [uncultured Jatrophihabitans sp.]|uniref:alpha/beta fold hydrolase n=1 Tax=uncultured Jatrophihabitans sp. TaxID=1610747 RepID=UPI0035CADF25